MVCLLGAQAPAPQPAGYSVPAKMTARLMHISVVVHDKKGAPVLDLTNNDFVLYDQGQEQKIRYFSKETSDPLPDNVPAMGLPGRKNLVWLSSGFPLTSGHSVNPLGMNRIAGGFVSQGDFQSF